MNCIACMCRSKETKVSVEPESQSMAIRIDRVKQQLRETIMMKTAACMHRKSNKLRPERKNADGDRTSTGVIELLFHAQQRESQLSSGAYSQALSGVSARQDLQMMNSERHSLRVEFMTR